MSTSETKPPKQSSGELSGDVRSDASPTMVSERARAIARRSFLRRSAGIAAPVVMTLQSGPVMAIASITCQDKTGQLVLDNQSGFTGPNAADKTLAFGQTTTDPTTLIPLGSNDGIVRCPATPTVVGTFPPDRFEDAGAPPWSFFGPDNNTFVNSGTGPVGDTGAIAYFSIGADNEDVFMGCFGASNSPENKLDTHPLSCSCWSSLHP